MSESEGSTDSSRADSTSEALVNTAFWEPLDSFKSNIWQESNWSNGGFFRSAFKPDHVTFLSGAMTLKLDNVPSSGLAYSGGEYASRDTFAYGKFEANLIAAKCSGTVSSFFLYTNTPVWDEIDVEFLGKNTSQVQFNYFVNGVGGHEHIHNLGFDASLAYHKFQIEWGNGWINWWVDGVWAWGVNNTGLNAPVGAKLPSHSMKVMANLWAGVGVDGWLGPFVYSGPVRAKYDYFKYTP